MSKAEVITARRYSVNERYTIVENVLKVSDPKFIAGIKAAFVLLDVDLLKPRLLIDNSEPPYDFHMHTALPEDKSEKLFLNVFDYESALAIFYDEVRRIVHE